MTFHFDMDGVLVDLYGALAAAWGEDPHVLKEHGEDTFRKYKEWVWAQGGPTTAFAGLPPRRMAEMKDLMRRAHAAGMKVGILTSLGVQPTFAYPDEVQAGKTQWLRRHYADLLGEGVITQMNFVHQGPLKAGYATPTSIVLDDSAHVVQAFRGAGGIGVLYDPRQHAASIGKALSSLPRRS